VQILLWLVPAAVATTAAALWAAYAGRERRPEPDRKAELARIGEALDRDLPRRAS
jgi:cytochrome c-type biogenesis protein CcmH/NrfF